MPEQKSPVMDFNWRPTTFEGACREQLRRWAQLPLENILLAIEEMVEVSGLLASTPGEEGHPPDA